MGRVLLIGGGGFIGAHLARELLDRGHDVVVLDDDRTYLPGGEPEAVRARAWRRETLLSGAELRAGGPDDPALLAHEVRAAAPDAVVHLANLPLAGVAAADPREARRSIVDGTANVLAATAEQAPAARLTFVSSSMVYGDFSQDPQPESAPLRPCEPYGACKLEAERLVRASGLRWTIVRPVGGLRPRRRQRPLPAAPRRGGDDGPHAAAHRRPGDAAGLHLGAGSRARPRRRGAQPRRDRRDVQPHRRPRALARRRDPRGPRARPRGRRPPPPGDDARPRRGTLDIARARSVLGYRPSCSLEDGLAAYLDARPAPRASRWRDGARSSPSPSCSARAASTRSRSSRRSARGPRAASATRALMAADAGLGARAAGRRGRAVRGGARGSLRAPPRRRGRARAPTRCTSRSSRRASGRATRSSCRRSRSSRRRRASLRAGAVPVFADVDEHLLLDPAAARAALSPRTRAILAVDLFGQVVDARRARRRSPTSTALALVEDAAQALGARARQSGPRGRSVGLLSCCSFDPTKTVAAPGSGGAVLTDDDDLAAHLRRLRWHGRDTGGRHVELGFNSQLPTASAAVLHDKLVHDDAAWTRAAKRSPRATTRRSKARRTARSASRRAARTSSTSTSCAAPDRDALREHLRGHGIPTLVHYAAPLARQPMFDGRCRELPCPVAERACAEVLSLPIHAQLTDAEVDRVTAALARP